MPLMPVDYSGLLADLARWVEALQGAHADVDAAQQVRLPGCRGAAAALLQLLGGCGAACPAGVLCCAVLSQPSRSFAQRRTTLSFRPSPTAGGRQGHRRRCAAAGRRGPGRRSTGLAPPGLAVGAAAAGGGAPGGRGRQAGARRRRHPGAAGAGAAHRGGAGAPAGQSCWRHAAAALLPALHAHRLLARARICTRAPAQGRTLPRASMPAACTRRLPPSCPRSPRWRRRLRRATPPSAGSPRS